MVMESTGPVETDLCGWRTVKVYLANPYGEEPQGHRPTTRTVGGWRIYCGTP
jgi:hypothetical protein